MTYPTADLVRMMLRNHPFYVEPANQRKPRIFEEGNYEHPWYEQSREAPKLNKPEPPSEEAKKKAKFKDKTYEWRNDSGIRSRDKRSPK